MDRPESLDDLKQMVDEKGDGSALQNMTVGELRARLRLGNMLLRMMRKDDDMRTDPRCPEREAELQAQVRVVNEALQQKLAERRAERGIPDPHDVQVGIKPTALGTRARG